MKKLLIPENSVCLITDRLNRKYLAETDVAEGILVVGKKTAYFTDARYYFMAREKLAAVGVEAKLYTNLDGVFDFIKNLGAEKVLVDYKTTTVKEYNEYREFNLPIEDAGEYLEKARSIKSQTELDVIKKACDVALRAYTCAIKKVRKGMTESQLKDIIESNIIEFGGLGSSFDIIVAFGKNSAVPHHETGSTKLGDNSVILVDMGANFGGYMSDITRTAFFGNPTEKFLDCYDAVLGANILAEEKIISGMACVDADNIARNYFKERGYDKNFTHSLGHGIGLEIHEYPFLSPKSNAIIENGMTFTVEPGVYFDGEFGIRIEDTVVMENGRVTRLFSDDKSLNIIK